MIWSIAWRNVWRNKLRSSVVIIAVVLGMFAGVFSVAFMKGISDQRIRTAIEVEGLTHLQLHQKEFTQNLDLHKYIKNFEDIENKILEGEHVKGVSSRIIITTLANSARANTGVKVWGIDPEKEKTVSQLSEKLIEGEFLKDYKRLPSVVIGNKLAEKLKVKLNNRIRIKFIDINGHQTEAAFKISGIFETVNTMYDEMNVFVNYKDITRLIGFPDDATHEIAVLLDNKNNVSEKLAEIQKQFPDLEIKPWTELSPEVGFLDEMMEQYMYIFVIIILLALCFGIINTMLMVVLERVKELGMLMAVGMNRKRVFRMIMLETVFLTLTGGIIGIALGMAASQYFSKVGIDLSVWGEGISQMGYDTMAYPSIDASMTVTIIIMVIITGLLSSIYPARKALKLNPAEAVRTDI